MVQKGIRARLFGRNVSISPSRVVLYLVVMAFVAFTALPLIYVVSTAFKPLDELIRFPPLFFVRRPTLQNFSDLLFAVGGTEVPFLRYVINSVLIAAATVFLTVAVSSVGAYSMVKMNLPFKKALFSIIIMALMFPTTLLAIPNYLIINSLGFMDSYWALIIPRVAGAFGFFFMKQFCEQLPDSFLEAARLDGASEWQIFRKVVFPFIKPATSTLVVFAFIGSWNDSFSPLVYITKDAMRTLPLALQSIGSGGALARAGAMAAATFLTTLPTVLLYTFMQKRVISTMAYSGIK